MISKDKVVELHGERRRKLASYHAAGQRIRDAVEGKHTFSIPELDTNEAASVANLILTGVEQHGMRIGSTLPVIDSPPMADTRAAKRRGVARKNAQWIWWYQNKIPLLFRQRARDLVALGTSPVLVRPSKDGIPKWEWMDPLSTFPSPLQRNEMVPENCIVAFRRPWSWLRQHSPAIAQTGAISMGESRKQSPDQMYDVLQYMDAEEFVMVVVGQTTDNSNERVNFEMSHAPNKAGRPVVTIPGRITLGALQGQFDQMLGMYENQAELAALNMHAIRRAIFKETWVYGDDPAIETQADAYDGTVGIVKGGQLATYGPDPGVQTQNAIDQQERAMRLIGAVPADFGGESPSNVRTARRGSQTLSAVVDYPVQEAQELLAASAEEELKTAVAVAKGYWPNTSRTFQMPGSARSVTYTPVSTFEEGACSYVRYSYAGADVDSLVIAGGQRIGMGTLSQKSFMEFDPLVVDADLEHDRILVEGREKAHLAAIQNQAADPNGPYQPADFGRLTQLIVEENLELWEAEMKLHEEIQARQAQAAQGQLSPEQMQPGNAMPGAPGSPEMAAPIGEPQPSMEHLTSLLGNLRLQQRQAPAETAGVV